MRDSGGDLQLFPVYFSIRARQNISSIITIYPTDDTVPDFWANVFSGLDDNTAIALTK